MLRGSERIIMPVGAGQPGPEGPPAEGPASADLARRRLGIEAPPTPVSTTPAAEVGGGGEDRGRVTETQRTLEPERGPDWEPNNNPEWLASPERGRWLVEQVTYMETNPKFPYEVRWNAENGPRLYYLSRELIKFVWTTERDRHRRAPFKAEEAHPIKVEPDESLSEKQFVTKLKVLYDDLSKKAIDQVSQEENIPPIDFTEIDARGHDLDTLTAKFEDMTIPPDEKLQVEEDLLKYFQEGKRLGLLRGADEVFNALFLEFSNGNRPAAHIRALLEQQAVITPQNPTPMAYAEIEDKIRRKATDPEVNPRLLKIAHAYILWNRAKLRDILNGIDRGPYREGEWQVPDEKEEGEIIETYWEPSPNYPTYYMLHAKNPREFKIAKETFMRMLKSHALGYAPAELTQFYQNFKNLLDGEAKRLAMQQENDQDGPNKMTKGFVDELRQEFDADFYSWGAAYYSEHYNKDGAKQYSQAMYLDEGPQRLAAMFRSNDGEVAFHTQFQDDLHGLFEFALNAQGSRGQFKDSIVQNYIANTLTEIQIERGMGVVIKDYDNRDLLGGLSGEAFEARLNRARYISNIEAVLKRNKYQLDSLPEEEQKYYLAVQENIRGNISRLTLYQSDEDFATCYEEFYTGNAHRNNYRAYIEHGHLTLKDLPKRLRDSVRLGGIQVEVDKFREQVRAGEVVLRPGETIIKKLRNLKRISRKDENFYENAHERSAANYEAAMQLQQMTHETTVRGGGVYFVYRNKCERAYMEARERYLEASGEKLKQGELSFEKMRDEWHKAVESKLSLEERKARWTKEEHTGWVLHEMRMGTRLDTFPEDERRLIRGLSPEDRQQFTDNISTQLATKAVMAVANAIRMKYADDSPIWQEREDLAYFVHEKNKKGNFKYPNFRAVYRTEMVNRAINDATERIYGDGFTAQFSDREYEVLDFDPEKKELKFAKEPLKDSRTKVIDHPIMYKTPHVFGYTALGKKVVDFSEDKKPIGLETSDFDETDQPIVYDKPAGSWEYVNKEFKWVERKRIEPADLEAKKAKYSLTEWQTKTGEKRFTAVDSVRLSLETAIGSHLELHTLHTYFAYQSNTTDSLAPPHVWLEAEQIRDGVLKAEDADPHAALLLTLDPTLHRLKFFEGPQMAIEGIVFDAAVDESFMTWVHVRKALNKKFSPRDGDSEFMQMGYYIEDRGGDARFSMMMHNLVSKMPKRWARRFAAETGDLPMYASTTADNVGVDGVRKLVALMDDEIHKLSGQRIVSQFGLMKSLSMFDNSTQLWFALIGGTDPQTGKAIEGTLLKPLANNDKLVEEWRNPNLFTDPAAQNAYLYKLKDSFARIEKLLHDELRKMYAEARNAQGALLLDKTDIFLPNGRYNPEIDTDRNTGSSRQIGKEFWDAYVAWLTSREPGGGIDFYGESAAFYEMLNRPYLIYDGEKVIPDPSGKTWADFLFDKMIL